ncbi:MAG: hypothetical protein UR85_C0002G0040 [Candidatus Nomurabacteria bacterium GW2011_GWF2_35_66]|uniref:Uncharacterized protein n=1 Tax=Candidatus Nomurabacteria bacterium GW2011_GWE1_35_16 TaxID=1618761 RepID=A0A0G0DTX6_9BACT|nr:MAG: hypothetical protein UR55_C0007G0002 [Candidatus Nomurabacteria bacterium GW2011_GWF1_34_20]KKP63277.1 MAG: hypothetical protein UR57_C0006G0002 [Candidatus Nomurabacteria bacterium GW2011_GWE2_34_25]KKP66475.1 MAG: hypothetical protein UR64_C0006G0002 [Candidatus Nomurabacteria bacterium GW2011_GWE1_35_16]KKP83727.1 MAG: hypothetical protein UR85_C0002G0040 [Candidatus Nomurabacteria bacterium GW2011_GWF2_35_66]HAE36417.1 hypothetical protein [Candidatus Nomurabacteria bacterium]
MTKLHTYALIKTLFDQNKDYFDTLSPLVLSILSDSSFEGVESVKLKISTKYKIDIPIHILKTIFSRIKNKGYVETQKDSNFLKIIQKGKDFINELESIEDVERRNNSFLLAVSDYFNTNERKISQDETRELIESFIQDNIEGVIDFINPKQTSENLNDRINRKDGALIVLFLKDIKQSKPSEYNQFKEIVLGSILSSLLYSESSSDIVDLESKKIKRGFIFFDSNFIFSLLNLHSNEKNIASRELFDLIKNMGFKLRVFDFTLNEICRVMNGYIKVKNQYPESIPVDHIYSILKKQNFESSDITDFIYTIEEKVESLGIEIFFTDVDLNNYLSIKNEKLQKEISQIKTNDFNGLSTNHDIAAIDKIREIRKKTVRRIEDSEAFFLTSDFALQKKVIFYFGHKDNGTLSEVILDRVFANILWLKNPNIEIPLSNIIATHSRDLLIDRKVWEKFYNELDRLKKNNTINTEQIENLFYHRNIDGILTGYDRSNLDKINSNLIIDAIEEANVSLSEKEKENAKSFLNTKERLFTVESEKDKEIQKYNEKIIAVKGGLDNMARKWAYVISISLFIFSILIFFIVESLIFYKLYFRLSIAVFSVFSALFGGSLTTGVCILLNKFRFEIFKYFKNKIYSKLLIEVKES